MKEYIVIRTKFFFIFIPIYNGYELTKYGFKSRTEAAISSAGIDLK